MSSTFILTSAHFSHSLPTATIKCHDNPRVPLLPIVGEIDLIIIMIMANVTSQEHVCVRRVKRGSRSAVLSASLWRSHSSVCLALSSPLRLKPTYLLRPRGLLQAGCSCNTTPSYFLDFLSSSQMKSTSRCSRRIGQPDRWLSGSLLDCTACLIEALRTHKTDKHGRDLSPPWTQTNTQAQGEEWSKLNTGLTMRRWSHAWLVFGPNCPHLGHVASPYPRTQQTSTKGT